MQVVKNQMVRDHLVGSVILNLVFLLLTILVICAVDGGYELLFFSAGMSAQSIVYLFDLSSELSREFFEHKG